MSLAQKQVFFDASGARTRWTTRAFLVGYLTLFVLCAVFSATVIDLPRPVPLALSMERPRLRPTQPRPVLRAPVASDTMATRAPNPARPTRPLRVGFYVPWDDTSGASLAQHIDQLDWLVPALISVTGPAHRVRVAADVRLDAALARSRGPVALFPMVQNGIEEDWDGDGAAALLRDPAARAALLDRVAATLAARKAQGVVFDFEELPATANPDYLRLIHEARARFADQHRQVIVTLPADSSAWELKVFSTAADRLIVKLFGEHREDSAPGPIASPGWFGTQLDRAVAVVEPRKLIVAIGSFAYDWPVGGGQTGSGGQLVSVEEAWLTARDSQAAIQFDPPGGAASFAYEEDDRPHEVWLLDAASGWNQLRAARLAGVAGVAIWRLGTEDSGVWTLLRNPGRETPPDLSRLRSASNIDVEGRGEILRIAAVPTDGTRTITTDRHGTIVDERYGALPTPFVVHRTGDDPGAVALTFDDGPDARWTPEVLDILRDKHVPATFFVIGQNALRNRTLLSRIVAEGHEIGNHSFTHPNLAAVSPEQARLELNVSQRLVQAYTGRSMRLFRAPYFSDAEATTADELGAALIAQENGYTNVGLHVDPQDWRPQSADAIVQSVLAQVADRATGQTRQIVLLHDSGGDRGQTVLALPRIIDGLRARGYRLVGVSALAGLRRSDTMPAVAPRDLVAVRADIGLFLLLAGLGEALLWLFYVAILIGIARAVIMTFLALCHYGANRGRARPGCDPALLVSVLIPAFNEERVIAASIRQVLASRDVAIEVIVIDDGSRDATAAVVEAAFGSHPAVRLVSLPNGGKANALNHGIGLARGDVLIALDADTLFEPETIARLCRWFGNPKIGAVAGNVRVGNKINLVTRWQSIEYVTAQNLDRRALSAVGSITVVPGAVGAIRRAALTQAGGYSEDTLAEDQDLTIQIQRNGWKVAYDPTAMAWTEAPESLPALARQRFRWSFGTLQCLWKHRSIYRSFRPAGLALIGLPQTWLLQIGFAIVAPLIDVLLALNIVSTAVHWSQHGWGRMNDDVETMALYWLVFTAIDILCGCAAYAMEPRRERCPVILLVAQRLIYRQLLYWVTIRAVMAALRGPPVRWGKPKRSGRVALRRRGLFERLGRWRRRALAR